MSAKRLYVGNVSKFTSELELKEAFAEHGKVLSVALVCDRRTGKSKGIGFVEYETIESAEVGRLALNGSMLHGHLLTVDVAYEQKARPTNQSSK